MLSKLADFLCARRQEIIAEWVAAIERDPDIQSANNLSYQQLVDHMPALFDNLADALREENLSTAARSEATANAETHGAHRWHQGYELDEIIRETSIIRRTLIEHFLDRFASENPRFAEASRAAAEKLCHKFLDDMAVASTRQFLEEQQRRAEEFTARLECANRALQASEQSNRAILESALDCIIVMDAQGRVCEFNPAAERIFGFSRVAVIGRELADLIIPANLRERHRQGLAHFMKTGEGPLLGRRIEVPAVRANGEELLVELAITTFYFSGEPVFTAYLREITERVRSERRRTAQYAIANLIAGSAPLTEIGPQILSSVAESGQWIFGALWLVNEDGAIVCHSTWQVPESSLAEFEATSRATVFRVGEGLPGRVVAGKQPVWVHEMGEEQSFPRRPIASASGLHGGFAFPLSAGGKVNGVIELFSQAAATADDDLKLLVEALGSQIGLFIERKRTEEEMELRKEAAEAANAAKDQFLATLSHELRTPLTPVLMWAYSALDQPGVPAAFQDDLRMVCRNIELEARLIDDLLDLTRIVQGKLALRLQRAEADTLLLHAIEIVRADFAAKQLQIIVELEASNHRVSVDPPRLQQVFWNVLKNAGKFTPAGGSVRIRSFNTAPDRLAFEIRDNGIGIDADFLPKIFIAFEQGNARREGLGLGLAISKVIMEMHGGSIVAKSEGAGTGAEFVIELSAIPATAGDTTLIKLKARAPGRALRILVTDDHEETAALLARVLTSAGHEVTTAHSVQSAREVLAAEQFDLLISDIGLPDGSGFELMRECKSAGAIKGIAVSGYGMPEDVRRSEDAGFSAHLTKPINVGELERLIQRVVAEK